MKLAARVLGPPVIGLAVIFTLSLWGETHRLAEYTILAGLGVAFFIWLGYVARDRS